MGNSNQSTIVGNVPNVSKISNVSNVEEIHSQESIAHESTLATIDTLDTMDIMGAEKVPPHLWTNGLILNPNCPLKKKQNPLMNTSLRAEA